MLTLVGLLVGAGIAFALFAVLTVAVFGSDHGHRTVVDDEDRARPN